LAQAWHHGIAYGGMAAELNFVGYAVESGGLQGQEYVI